MPELLMLRDLPRYEMLQEKARRYPDLDAGAVEATLVLLRVASDVLEGLSAHYARNGTSEGRNSVMMMLDHPTPPEGMSPSILADKLGVSRATITGLVDGLERDGLVSRQPNPEDRRAFHVQLTDKGGEFLLRTAPSLFRRVAGLMAHLDGAERRQLIDLLAKVARGQNAMRDEHWTPDPQSTSDSDENN